MQKFRVHFIGIPVAFMIINLIFPACNKDDGGRLPLPPMDITIDPNSTIYQEVNFVGGWLYLGEQDGVMPPSRGIILYRLSTEQFMAYERTPPFKPDSCCNANKTVCSSLIVDYPFVQDTCTNSKYLILDGSPNSGPSTMTLSMYVTEYNGDLLYIHD
jgi:hypothetical protein